MSDIAICLKPCISILIEYLAGGRETRRNTPRSSETAVRTRPVDASVAVTVAPGTTPVLSPIVPVTAAFPWPCANAVDALASNISTATQATSRTFLAHLPSMFRLLSDPDLISSRIDRTAVIDPENDAGLLNWVVEAYHSTVCAVFNDILGIGKC